MALVYGYLLLMAIGCVATGGGGGTYGRRRKASGIARVWMADGGMHDEDEDDTTELVSIVV